MRILFICTGNTCRSPIAEIIGRNSIENILFESAGIFALDGERMSAAAEKVLAEKSYEVLFFGSRRVNEGMLREADLILTMTSEQKEIINSFFEKEKSKIFTLKEYNNSKRPNLDIADPFGGDISRYRDVLKDIEEEIWRLKERLRQNN